MKKLIRGIIQFRRNLRQGYQERFSGLAAGQMPDTLFIACSDSRVVPNTFASTDPGDLFVIRNVGNLIPPCCGDRHSLVDESEAAAIEYALLNLNVSDIIICGHSECGAMQALLQDREKLVFPNLQSWLRHGDTALDRLQSGFSFDPTFSQVNQLSQLNVLLQMEHMKTYSIVQQGMAQGRLKIHGWWFDITKADVYFFDQDRKRFVLFDEEEAHRALEKID